MLFLPFKRIRTIGVECVESQHNYRGHISNLCNLLVRLRLPIYPNTGAQERTRSEAKTGWNGTRREENAFKNVCSLMQIRRIDVWQNHSQPSLCANIPRNEHLVTQSALSDHICSQLSTNTILFVPV